MNKSYRFYTGICCIVSLDEFFKPLDEIDPSRHEGWIAVAISKEEAIQKVRKAFQADELEDATTKLKIELGASMSADSPDAVMIYEPSKWVTPNMNVRDVEDEDGNRMFPDIDPGLN